jgi:hypothetical protein
MLYCCTGLGCALKFIFYFAILPNKLKREKLAKANAETQKDSQLLLKHCGRTRRKRFAMLLSAAEHWLRFYIWN